METKLGDNLQLLSPALNRENVKSVLTETFLHMDDKKVKNVTLAEMNHSNGLFGDARLSLGSYSFEEKTRASIVARMNLKESTSFSLEEQESVVENLLREKNWKIELRDKKDIIIDTGKAKMVLTLTYDESELEKTEDPMWKHVLGRGIVAVVLPNGATSGLDTTINGVEQSDNIDQLTDLVVPTLDAMTKIMKAVNIVKSGDSQVVGSKIVNWTEPKTV